MVGWALLIPRTHIALQDFTRISEEVHNGRLDLIMLDEVKELMDRKWQSFAKPIYRRRFAVASGVQALFLISSVLHPHDGMPPWRGQASTGCQILIACVILWQLWREARTVCLQGSAYRTHAYGAAMLQKVLGLLFYISFGVAVVLQHGPQWARAEHVVAAAAALLGWSHIFSLLLGFKSFGPFIIMILEMIRYDIRRFSAVFVVMLLGFNLALYHVMAAYEGRGIKQFFGHMEKLLVLGLVGETSGDTYEDMSGVTFVLCMTLTLIYTFLMAILLLNLLIAMMGNTYSTILGVSLKRWNVERGNMMMAFEAEYTKEQMRMQRQKYAVSLNQDTRRAATSDDLYLEVTKHNKNWQQVPETYDSVFRQYRSGFCGLPSPRPSTPTHSASLPSSPV